VNSTKIYEWIIGAGVVLAFSPLLGQTFLSPNLLYIGITIIFIGTILFSIHTFKNSSDGVQFSNTFDHNVTTRKLSAYILGGFLTGFYIVLYWFPSALESLIRAADPLSQLIRKTNADQWFVYGTFYTVAVVVMGIRSLFKYRSSNYHKLRILSVIFFQLFLAWLIPGILKSMNQPEFYFSYFWPLKYDYLFPGTVDQLLSHPGNLGIFMVFWASALTFIATPILTYFFGKRWYCSWVCGCGGLAETAGDPFRHLSSSTSTSWKLEKRLIYPILGFIVITTAIVWINSLSNGEVLGGVSGTLSKTYGFFIGSLFSGVIGVGFYPILGTRVWCRFGCPMAAILGIQQKLFSRFRITTNGAQCISCGNCSTYCEMGIDVKSYAQKGKNIIRASCVGCGICATVCPRGVLKLENGKSETRYNKPLKAGNEGWKIS
jgi:ferredoxin-type protein NapH